MGLWFDQLLTIDLQQAKRYCCGFDQYSVCLGVRAIKPIFNWDEGVVGIDYCANANNINHDNYLQYFHHVWWMADLIWLISVFTAGVLHTDSLRFKSIGYSFSCQHPWTCILLEHVFWFSSTRTNWTRTLPTCTTRQDQNLTCNCLQHVWFEADLIPFAATWITTCRPISITGAPFDIQGVAVHGFLLGQKTTTQNKIATNQPTTSMPHGYLIWCARKWIVIRWYPILCFVHAAGDTFPFIIHH